MKETEVRDRIRSAFGDSNYPPELTHRVVQRLHEPPPRGGRSAVVGVVAVIVAVAIVGTLVFTRFQAPAPKVPAVTPPPPATPQPVPPARAGIPQADLDQAQLPSSGDLVTQFNLTSTSNGRTVTLIGAYADSARTVVFFRTVPPAGSPNVAIYDDAGFLNASATGGSASFGDSYYVLDAGPRAGSDGVAHLKVVLSGFVTPPASQTIGDWTFSFPLSLSGAEPLSLTPPLTTVGTWKFSIETFVATSEEIHFQAVVEGAAVEDINESTFSLVDSIGRPRQATTYAAATTVPKSQITASPPRSTRVTIAWNRAVNGGLEMKTGESYSLVIRGGGAEYRGTFPVGILPTKGSPPGPTAFPASNESLRIDGGWSAAIRTGRPTACGVGTGPSGTIFGFGTLFQVDQDWYEMSFYMDPAVRQYTGPGTYSVRADISPWAPLGAGPIFRGTVQLKVNSHNSAFGPWSGSVDGTLTWTGAAAQPYTVTISGNWFCTFSDNLGPA